MMRAGYQKQLEDLHTELIHMGALCEEAIAAAVTGLLDENRELREKAIQREKDIDLKEREIESICVRLLLREQPVAGDLRQITAAQRMITDMERIGDQAADIAELAEIMYGGRGGLFANGKTAAQTTDKANGKAATTAGSTAASVREAVKSSIHIGDMTEAVTEMLTASVDSFVQGDLLKTREVIKMDDRVDELFRTIKGELIEMIALNSKNGGACLDILMIAKYLERIGDHAVNIAEWVIYSITGERGDPA
jgi:phosphate transport system protein